jgi:CBS domain-containing protein
VVSTSEEATILDAVKLMEQHNMGCVAVTDKEKPVGIITDRDIVLRVVARNKKAGATLVNEAITRNPVVLRDDIGLYDALKQMKDQKFRRIPIVNASGKLREIIIIDDLFSLLVKEMSYLTSIVEKEYPKI